MGTAALRGGAIVVIAPLRRVVLVVVVFLMVSRTMEETLRCGATAEGIFLDDDGDDGVPPIILGFLEMGDVEAAGHVVVWVV